MTRISILNGIFVDADPAFRTSYPRNLVPVPKDTEISKGFLRPADGLIEFSTSPGVDRGGIDWDGLMYRVKGANLVSIDENGVEIVIGNVDTDINNSFVTMVYSFDFLAIASNKKLWLYDKTTLAQNVDPDLGIVLDVVFIDGYFMTTDGEFLVVTELGDPFSVNPLKFGSSEVDPDPIVALLELRNEVYVVNTNTIEVFRNIVTTDLFPFVRIKTAQIEKGAVDTHAATVLVDTIAFLGNGRNEALGVYLGVSGRATKISTAEIDERLALYTADELKSVVVESRIDRSHEFLYLHFPDVTFVFDRTATGQSEEFVWFTLDSAGSRYRARGFVRIYNKWLAGDPTGTQIGEAVETVSDHFGDLTSWEFSTMVMYDGAKGVIFHELELIALTGAVALDKDPVVTTQWSEDGITFSQPRTTSAGKKGDRSRRIRWFKQGRMVSRRIQKFTGTSDTHVTFAALEARLENLNW